MMGKRREQGGGIPAGRILLSVMAAASLTLALYTAGSAAGDALLRMQKEYRIELFDRAAAEQGVVARMISDEETHNVTSKYIAALADAVIRFEFFPRDDDARIFFELISVIPARVTVDRFAFTGRNLAIYCAAPSQELLVELTRSLGDLGCFRDASLESYQKKDGSFVGTITCLAA